MSEAPLPRQERVLVLDADAGALPPIAQAIEGQLPDAEVSCVQTLEDCRQEVVHKDFDLVVLGCALNNLDAVQFIQQLRLRDYEPSVLVVSSCREPRVVSEVYNAGCHRYVVREGLWESEIGPAARHLLRIRRLEDENNKLLAKLTEANMMLEEKNRRLDEFSATVAHDIRGPLGGICMKLEYLLEAYRPTLQPRSEQLVERALQSAHRLTDIVQAMYEFAKIGSRAARMSEFSLGDLVREVVSDMHFNAALDIRIGIDPDLPQAWGSPELLRRVFINLINNAVKYNDKKEVVINVGFRRELQRTLGKFAEIYVEDNGPGINPAEIQEIFKMFGRGSGVAREKEGLGVGLCVAQRILELHYGGISVESRPGKGATFVVVLPLERVEFIG